jgi:hypothetical protein
MRGGHSSMTLCLVGNNFGCKGELKKAGTYQVHLLYCYFRENRLLSLFSPSTALCTLSVSSTVAAVFESPPRAHQIS